MRFCDGAAFEAWLEERHGSEGGVWLAIARKGSAEPLLTIEEAGEAAMCFGWIDGHRRALDGGAFLQRFSRRRPRSPWSQVNVARAEALMAAGRMREPGSVAVRAARADGRWDAAYAPQSRAEVPVELVEALAADAAAAARFEALDRTARYLLVLPLLKAGTAAVRARRLAAVVAALA
ncbi:YdeI/OmpD-associated family protein [Actinomadura sp. PM05-2]|uniref:YdeI/OmpD-associated family protein n=2 Tax=Actinomadura parmotrematis TaxID=2864039 RepID=A0ABS7G661_9ACTN|nr:YdeI/OmpD-associated family protein [Actinomadura parmotrematis]